ncbi:MAG: hypothetical protein RLO52_31415 [Sandaracinaceae bacterium]|nr:MAG: hypothetical protein EVA89_34020 [Sandaracinaceae bacterium]
MRPDLDRPLRRVLLLSALLLAGCGAATPPAEEPEEEAEAPPSSYAIALRFADAGTDENETPHTRVLLVRIAPDGERVARDLGTETGACYHQDPADALIQARCWWAGAGARYEVRREGDAVIALRADVDEMTEDAALEETARVEVPRAARLQVLAPGAAPDAE